MRTARVKARALARCRRALYTIRQDGVDLGSLKPPIFLKPVIKHLAGDQTIVFAVNSGSFLPAA